MAYVTAFYMFRVWWLTFFTQPRDEHVYRARRAPRRAVGDERAADRAGGRGGRWSATSSCTFVHVDRVDAARPARGRACEPTGTRPRTPSTDPGRCSACDRRASAWRSLIYRKGFGVAERIRRPIEPLLPAGLQQVLLRRAVHAACSSAARWLLCRLSDFWDKWVIDGLVNLAGLATKVVAFLSGLVRQPRRSTGRPTAWRRRRSAPAGRSARRRPGGFGTTCCSWSAACCWSSAVVLAV